MAFAIAYTQVRSQLAHCLDEVAENQEIVIIGRRGKADVAMIAADELNGLLKTAYSMRSPKNARRL